MSARDRPENSLLEAVVDVERASRPAVQMTAEKSATIEDMIKARIAEERCVAQSRRRLAKRGKLRPWVLVICAGLMT